MAGTITSWTRVACLLAGVVLVFGSGMSYADSSRSSSSTFGFSIHHRFSDAVRKIFPAGDDEVLPEVGSVGYFAAMAERDRIHGRRLAAAGSTESAPLTFVAGNATIRLAVFGYLYYANVSVGTPGLDFLVALDTGSDLFWLPCDCHSCISGIQTRSGEITFNIYGLNTSSTGKQVSCANSLCEQRSSCILPSKCPYERMYLSSNTSSSGYLVDDVLHLTTDTDPSKPVDANITFGCGQVQTGSFLNGGAPNGLFGLGMEKISVPSVLASKNITADSFSMCFAHGRIGRISFGDKGSTDQAETPFNLDQSYRRYNISITQITVGENTSNVDVNAIFDSGTSFTVFSDPSYTIITDALNSQVKNKRFKLKSSQLPFEFCYEMSSCNSDFSAPSINLSLTMKGGVNYNLINPFVVVTDQSQCFYCLGMIKDQSVNIIGENFMTGYRIVFNREKMVLGWEASDCNYTLETTSVPMSPQNSPASPQYSPASPQSSPTSPHTSATAPSTLDAQSTSTTNSTKNSGAQSTAMKHWALALYWIAVWILVSS